MTTAPHSFWCDEADEILVAEWRKGTATSDIAAVLVKHGYPATKSKVIGRVGRVREKYGLDMRREGVRGMDRVRVPVAPPEPSSVEEAPRAVEANPFQVPAIAKAPVEDGPPVERPVAKQRSGCRWIDGQVNGPDTKWCDAPVSEPGGSWCAEHRSRVYAGLPPAKKGEFVVFNPTLVGAKQKKTNRRSAA